MAMFSVTDSNAVLNAVLQTAPYPTSTTAKIRLGSNAGTASSAMTEISGSGYTAGGQAISFNSASGQSASNSGAISWTNGGSAWSITGLEIWDTAGSPVRHLFGTWTGAPVSVGGSDVFAVAAGAVSASLV